MRPGRRSHEPHRRHYVRHLHARPRKNQYLNRWLVYKVLRSDESGSQPGLRENLCRPVTSKLRLYKNLKEKFFVDSEENRPPERSCIQRFHPKEGFFYPLIFAFRNFREFFYNLVRPFSGASYAKKSNLRNSAYGHCCGDWCLVLLHAIHRSEQYEESRRG